LDASNTDNSDDSDDPDDHLSAKSQINNNNTSQTETSGNTRAQPLIPVVEQILPVLVPVAEKWAKDEDAMESLFSIVKHTLATINSSSMTVLQYSMQLVLISFRISPLASSTSVAKQVSKTSNV